MANCSRKKITDFIEANNVYFIPMYDGSGVYQKEVIDANRFEKFKHYKIISFCKILHQFFIQNGFSSFYLQYAQKIDKKIIAQKQKPKILFVYRRKEISWLTVKELIKNANFDSVHIHNAEDPGHPFTSPCQDDINKFKIKITNWLENKEDYNKLLDAADIFIAPRLYEGIGMAMLDAMNRGLCIVAPDRATMNEYIVDKKTGYLFDPKNPQPIDFSNWAEVATSGVTHVNQIFENYELSLKILYLQIKQDAKKFSIKQNLEVGEIAGKYLTYPKGEYQRHFEGGLRLKNIFKTSKPNQPLVSIVTVVFNNDKTLMKCMNSVFDQSYKNIEYIVIDGGSTDKTPEIIKSNSDKVDYFVSEKDGGIYPAMNKGVSLARGDYLLILNSDEWLEENAIKIAVKYMNRGSKILALPQCRYRLDGSVIGRFGLKFFDDRIYLRMPMPHQSLIHKDVYDEIGGYDTSYKLIADWDFFIRARDAGIQSEECNTENHLTNYIRGGATSSRVEDIGHPIHDEQVRMLHSRFPDIKDHDILLMLSSQMEETKFEDMCSRIQRYANAGGIIPPTILRGIELYIQKRFGDKKLAEFKKNSQNIFNNLKDFNEIKSILPKLSKAEKPIWIIGERGIDAKDNGFALLRHLVENNINYANIFYLISKTSPDYEKVKLLIDVDRILEPNSDQHKKTYLEADYVLSTQGGSFAHPLNKKILAKYFPKNNPKFGFLQHGILKDEISYFHKGKFNHDFFVISGEMEFQLMTKNYNYPKEDLIVSGLPRFDYLPQKKTECRKIAFMPTWRSYIKSQEDLKKSIFFINIVDLLNSKYLKNQLKKNNAKLIFYLHPNNFKDHVVFKSSIHEDEFVEISNPNYDYSDVFSESSVAITDYSSVITDFPLIDTPILYFQPDYDVFRKNHYLETPYFSYESHGLGPVCKTITELVDELTWVFNSNFSIKYEYKKRRKYIYKNQDRKNCNRLIDGLIARDKYRNLLRENVINSPSRFRKFGQFYIDVDKEKVTVFTKRILGFYSEIFGFSEIVIADLNGYKKKIEFDLLYNGIRFEDSEFEYNVIEFSKNVDQTLISINGSVFK